MTSDATLARAAALGENAAFEQLYLRYRPGLLGFVLRLVGDHHMAEDIVQECFLIAWRDLANLRDPAAFRTWLFSIAYKRSMTHAGQPVHLPLTEAAGIPDDSPDVRPEIIAEQREARQMVWEAATSLAPRQRAVLELSVRWDLSSKEVAEVVGIHHAHAAVLVHRARSALGNAVKVMLVARQRHRCHGLKNLLGGTHKALTPRQRSSVDHHIRRCPECKRFSAHAASYATLAALLGKPGTSASTVHSGALALKLGAAAVIVTAAAGAIAYATVPEEPRRPPAITSGEAPTPPASLTAPPSPSAPPSAAPQALSPEAQMVDLINKVRSQAGCGPVTANAKLAQAAEGHSADMAANSYFSHQSQDGRTPWDRAKSAGYQWPSAENIAAGNAGAKATMDQLMNSPGHKANILNCSHKAVGVGRASGGPYRYYWTQLFGSR